MDAEEKALEFAQDVTKQFISLASAIPAFMITFSKDFVAPLPLSVKKLAFVSWGFFVLSILFGTLTLMALTGVLAERANRSTLAETRHIGHVHIMRHHVRWFAGLQIVLFFVGLVLVVVFGWRASS